MWVLTGDKVETAINLGIGMVHQEFTLVPSFTAPENIGLGQEPKNSRGLVDWKGLNKAVMNIAEKYGFKVDPGLKMIDASVGVQQRTEILKTLYRNANILILDEPTAVLTPQETDELFKTRFPGRMRLSLYPLVHSPLADMAEALHNALRTSTGDSFCCALLTVTCAIILHC